MYPKSLLQLIENYKMLPGVGEKTAERYALETLQWSNEDVLRFTKALNDVKNKIHKCHVCGNFTEEDKCSICLDKTRNTKQICVVQEAKDIIAIEKMGEYKGLYHVLGGAISTTKGILPNDLNIQSILSRVNDSIEEVIIATNPTVEGETTAMYVAKLLESKNINITRLAHGLPMGGHLDYADELTLLKAMENRQKI